MLISIEEFKMKFDLQVRKLVIRIVTDFVCRNREKTDFWSKSIIKVTFNNDLFLYFKWPGSKFKG